MNNYLSILRKALKDLKLDGLTCISSSESPRLSEIVKNLSPDACISEWRYGMGNIRYEYHVHQDGIAEQLREAFKNGVSGGHPKLTAIYSREELKKIILSASVGSGYQRDILQTHH